MIEVENDAAQTKQLVNTAGLKAKTCLPRLPGALWCIYTELFLVCYEGFKSVFIVHKGHGQVHEVILRHRP